MIVLDTSVAVAALTGHPGSRDAIARQRLVAPHLVDVEIAHALRGLVRGGKLSVETAGEALTVWQRLAVDRVSLQPLLPRVWELRDNLTAYDAAFVAAAEALGIPLVTADRRLAAATGPRCTVQLVPR